MTCQGPLLLGVFPSVLPRHDHLIKTGYHIMLLEHNMILSILLLYSGYVLSSNHIIQVLLADLYSHGILGITDPAPRL